MVVSLTMTRPNRGRVQCGNCLNKRGERVAHRGVDCPYTKKRKVTNRNGLSNVSLFQPSLQTSCRARNTA